ncbi:MAG TPA: murein biosynthesis integral membrane protein MurJ [Terriglobia bacterium]|nr:murein biosynthesis integral membrane protein MurJ [Terriglobia bacterium]
MGRSSLHRRIAESTGIVMGAILLSRCLGFLREWTVARQVGSNASTDAYYTAFTLPDFLNYLVAAGSLTVIFIPVFVKYLAEGREEESWHVFSTVVTFMAAILAVLIVTAEILAPQLISLIAPGFNPALQHRVVFLTRLMLPAQFCFFLGSILGAVQYAKGRFAIASLGSVVYNICIIFCGWWLSPFFGVTAFAIGVVAGSLLGNLLLQVYGVRRVGASFRPNLDLGHPGFRLFVRLAVPIMLALSVVYADDWIIRWFGSYLRPASITWLTYAKTLMRVPLAVVGGGVGLASFPFLARLYSEKRFEEFNHTLNSALKALILLLVPISALIMAQSLPLVTLVFSRTRLNEADLQATASTLACFSLGLFAWGAQHILSRGFYAARDTVTPAVVGTLLTFLNLPVYWLLFRRAQHVGLALASSAGIVAYSATLLALLNRRGLSPEMNSLGRFFLRVCTASAIPAVACYQLSALFQAHLAWRGAQGAFLNLSMVSTAGLVLFWLLAKALRIHELDNYLKEIFHWVRERSPRAPKTAPVAATPPGRAE